MQDHQSTKQTVLQDHQRDKQLVSHDHQSTKQPVLQDHQHTTKNDTLQDHQPRHRALQDHQPRHKHRKIPSSRSTSTTEIQTSTVDQLLQLPHCYKWPWQLADAKYKT